MPSRAVIAIAALLGLLLAAWAATAGEPVPPLEPPDGGRQYRRDVAWDKTRDALPQKKICFRKQLEYCPKDQAYLDRFIRYFLNKNHDGVMPTNQRHVAEVIRMSRAKYQEHMKGREGLDKVEQTIAAYYDAPEIEFMDGFRGATVNLGVPPGKLNKTPKGLVLSSPLVIDRQLDTREIARNFVLYGEKFQKQKMVRLVVDVPQGGTEYRRFDIRYFRDADRIVVFDPANREVAFATPRLGDAGFTPYLRGNVSLHTTALLRCPMTTYGQPPDCRGISLPDPANAKGLPGQGAAPAPARGPAKAGSAKASKGKAKGPSKAGKSKSKSKSKGKGKAKGN